MENLLTDVILFDFRSVSIYRRVALAAGWLFIGFGVTQAATINVESPSYNDVSAAITSASDGDTLVVPEGSASWKSTLTITKAITLIGATTITGTAQNPVITDKTIILDDLDRGTTQPQVLHVYPASGKTTRVSGITFRKSVATKADHGGIYLSGDGTSSAGDVRFDHCHLDQLETYDYMTILGATTGVVDHCVFDPITGTDTEAMVVNNGGGSYGDEAWAADPDFGSGNFLFIEDNTFNNPVGVQTNGVIDGYSGSRYVARYNWFYNCAGANTHGTESGGRKRSCRATEIYNNTYDYVAISGNAGQLRGGTAVIHDNALIGSSDGAGMQLTCYRLFQKFAVWGGASGVNGWDSNDSHGVYASGTASGAASISGASATVTMNGSPGWTTNQWVNYELYNATVGTNSYIKSNTSNTITYQWDDSYGGNMQFTTGNSYGIYKVLIALDQPGRGKGDLVKGDTPVNSTSGTVAWTNEALEPVYAWNNTIGGNPSSTYLYSGYPTLQENRDYYNNKALPGYTPYVYPHPLVSGGDPPPGAPKNLIVVP